VDFDRRVVERVAGPANHSNFVRKSKIIVIRIYSNEQNSCTTVAGRGDAPVLPHHRSPSGSGKWRHVHNLLTIIKWYHRSINHG